MKPGFASLLALGALLVPAVAWAQKAPVNNGPALTFCFPAAVEPGKSTDITVNGAKLEGATTLWTGFNASSQLSPDVKNNGTVATTATFRVTVPADVAPGIYGVRVGAKAGSTNVRLLMVDDLPTVREATTKNATLKTAQAITLPAAVEGICEATASDFYKFTVAAGQQLTFEVVARRLGYPLDAVLRLLDANGQELAYSDDELDTGADSRLRYKFATAGEYVVEVRDIRYQGGGMNRYRLRIGDFPIVTSPYPLAVQKGASATLAFAGKEVADAAPVTVTAPTFAPGNVMPIAVRSPQGQGSALASVLTSNAKELVEAEPNETSDTSNALTIPGAVNGRLDKRRDRDYYHFEAKAKQRFVFTGQTRSLGSPADLFLRIYKPDGTVAIEAEDSGMEEGSLDFTVPADGVYRLMVEDVSRRGGPQLAYRVAIDNYQPDFLLSIEVDKFDVPQEGVLAAKVICVRRGYMGPISLSVDGVPDCKVTPAVIGEGKTDTNITVTLPSSLQVGALAIINIVGSAKIGDVDFRTNASTLVAMRKALSGLAYPPAALDGSVGIGVAPPFPPFFKLTAASPVVAYDGKAATLKISAEKLNSFDDVITLAFEGLPKTITAKPLTIDKGKKEATIELSSKEAPANGKHAFKLIGSATFQGQPKQVVLADLALQVGPAAEVKLAPSGALAAGGKQKVTLTFAGLAAAKEPQQVKLTWKNVQPGVVLPSEATLAPGQDKLELELSAAADAAVGKILNVSVQATVKIDGKDVVLASTPVEFEVSQPK